MLDFAPAVRVAYVGCAGLTRTSAARWPTGSDRAQCSRQTRTVGAVRARGWTVEQELDAPSVGQDDEGGLSGELGHDLDGLDSDCAS
jgi:hypothetical protein